MESLKHGSGNRIHGGFNRSAGDAYSWMALDPTSSVNRGPCKADYYCGLFHCLDLTLILTADFSVYLTSRFDFDSGFFRFRNLDTLILTADFYVWYGAHGGCTQSAGSAYSSMTPDPTHWLLFVIFVILLETVLKRFLLKFSFSENPDTYT